MMRISKLGAQINSNACQSQNTAAKNEEKVPGEK
jgi:hypothetical protein